MPGVNKKEEKSYKTRNNVVFYLNKEQRHLVNVLRDIFEQRDLIPEGMSTAVLIKTVFLDSASKFLKKVSVGEMETAEQAVQKQEEEQKVANKKIMAKKRESENKEEQEGG